VTAAPAPVRWPVLGEEHRKAVLRVLDSGVLAGPAGPERRALEEEVAAALGVRYCLATNSGTAALHLALAGLGVGPGDEVIVPALGWVATAQAVLQQGAAPVFADVSAATGTLDPAAAARRLTRRTRALVLVHLHGLPGELDRFVELAREAGVALVEDAAQAHGATFDGRWVGTWGDAGIFSLNATKNLPAGEGGLLVTNREDVWARAVRWRFEGLPPAPRGDPARPLDGAGDEQAETPGWMYLPDEITCALARVGLERLPEVTARARASGRRMSARLSGVPGLRPPAEPPRRTHVYHKYRLLFEPELLGDADRPERARTRLLAALRAAGVEATLWQTAPLPHHPLFGRREAYPTSEWILARSVVLGSQTYPLFAQPPEVIDAWADAVIRVWGELTGRP
jgi:dTDP-4-amino-4,6-dideoxygalactose transaminase